MATAADSPNKGGGAPNFNLFQLREWASRRYPEKLPPTVLLGVTLRTIAILDKFPKAIYHVLILPRPREGISAEDMDNLKTLCSKAGKERAKEVLEEMGEHAKKVRDEIQQEMKQRYKFQWDVWIGFHAIPSMHHLHLHVISSDLHSEKMKNKKHYNSFHPKHGFFLHYDDVMSWFDAVPSFFDDKISLRPSTYEPILKQDLSCFQCPYTFKNMPTLKAHLENHHMDKYNAALKAEEREKRLKNPLLKPDSKVLKKRRHEGGTSSKPSSKASGTSRASDTTIASGSIETDGSDTKRRKTDSPI